ncbi:unnamed protein product [Lathyrus sativus]|nr:unnamed protein product [Lathyrus sativus]
MGTRGPLQFHPNSAAISKGYNFASTWEQNAPLTDHQQNAIILLTHAVSERPLPLKLVQENALVQDNALSVRTEDSYFDDSGAIKTVMVNTNQFYKWFFRS